MDYRKQLVELINFEHPAMEKAKALKDQDQLDKCVEEIIRHFRTRENPKYLFTIDDLRDIAFIGRSNVGKSSLINMLTNRKGLAKVSATPGKTRLINHFKINDEWYLVDLPGYGYARVSKTARGEFSKIITDYVLKCEKMHFLFVLIDSRLEPQKIDLRFIEMLGENGIPFGIIFTKADKLSATQLRRSTERFAAALAEQWEELPPMFRSSSEKGTGKEEILEFIDHCLKEF